MSPASPPAGEAGESPASLPPGLKADALSPYNWYGVLIVAAYLIAFLYALSRGHKIDKFGDRLADDETPARR